MENKLKHNIAVAINIRIIYLLIPQVLMETNNTKIGIRILK